MAIYESFVTFEHEQTIAILFLKIFEPNLTTPFLIINFCKEQNSE